MKETGKTKIIVFSDSHGSSVNMLKIAGLYRYSADYFIFLGDGLGDLQKIRDLTDKPLIAVPGKLRQIFFFSFISEASGIVRHQSWAYIAVSLSRTYFQCKV